MQEVILTLLRRADVALTVRAETDPTIPDDHRPWFKAAGERADNVPVQGVIEGELVRQVVHELPSVRLKAISAALVELVVQRLAFAELYPHDDPAPPTRRHANRGRGLVVWRAYRVSKSVYLPKRDSGEYTVLDVLWEEQAFSATASLTAAEISKKAHSQDPAKYKRPVSRLKKEQLIETATGRHGGCWLTSEGRRVCEELFLTN